LVLHKLIPTGNSRGSKEGLLPTVWSLHKIDLVAVGDGGGGENRRENGRENQTAGDPGN
jgi:hypothetical protein